LKNGILKNDLLQYLLIFRTPGRIDNAKKNKFFAARVLDPLGRMGRYINAVSRADLARFPADMHASFPSKNIINFGGFKGMRFGFGPGLYDGMRETVAISAFVFAGIQQFPEVAGVPGNEFTAFFQPTNEHATSLSDIFVP
jgi:hypothetical protein